MRYVLSDALRSVGYDVVVDLFISRSPPWRTKEEVLMLLKEYGGCVERVEDDQGRGVVDYVVFREPDGKGYVYSMYPHGRASMGVDPPIDTVNYR